jgi:hypothetical protein
MSSPNTPRFILYRAVTLAEGEDGSDVEEITLPTRKAVCPSCRGTGSHVNRNIDGNGLTREDFDEDPDFAESYFRGDYDVLCEECGGANVVDVLDEERCDPEVLRAFRKQEDEYRRDYESEAWLRRAESGERW